MSDKLWGGRFAQSVDELVEQYTESVSFDQALWREDIAGSRAHAKMLCSVGVLSQAERDAILDGLAKVEAEIESGAFQWRVDREDVHMNIEARLTELIGDPGKKLHTGRSRNDQVCLDFRLHVTRALAVWGGLLQECIGVLTQRAGEHADTLLPGCTHLQPAQPVSLGQHLLAYAWMLKRDFERAQDCVKRAAVSPLGAAALAGTTYPLQPQQVADELGLGATFANSLEAVADRDFVAEALFVAAATMMHTSRLCEEIILWAAPAYGYVKLPDGYATGSSIMPQKKNPDVAEIMRGKTGRVYGNLISLLTIMKGLPLAYNRDLQEDKEPFFDTDRTMRLSLQCLAGMMTEMEFVPAAMEAQLKRGFLNATELADYLVTKGLPFREAHHVTGRAVAAAEQRGAGLEDFGLDELRGFSELIGEDVFDVLDYRAAAERRTTPGGTAPERVKDQIKALKEWLEA